MDSGTIRKPLAANELMAEGVQSPRVLVIDDEPNIRELVQVALNFHGCVVAPARQARMR